MWGKGSDIALRIDRLFLRLCFAKVGRIVIVRFVVFVSPKAHCLVVLDEQLPPFCLYEKKRRCDIEVMQRVAP
jgi:hypothetical protein